MPRRFVPLHRKTMGYALCIHTCKLDGCRNLQGRVEWTREGNPLRKHAPNARKHPDCTPECPGYSILGLSSGTFTFSRPVDYDVPDSGDDGDMMDVDQENQPVPIPLFFSPPASSTLSVVGHLQNITPSGSGVSTSSGDLVEDVGMLSSTPLEPASRCFKIIYVPDPTRTATQSVAEGDLAFLKTTITQPEFKSIEHLAGSVHLVSQNHTQKLCTVYIQEWLRVMLNFVRCTERSSKRRRFTVKFIEWSKFLYTMLHRKDVENRATWEMLIQADCLIGGVDTTISYLNAEYGLNEDNVETYMHSINTLSRLVCIWPSSQQLELFCTKRQLIYHLDVIAATETRTLRPITRAIDVGDEIPSDVVLKRTHSDSGLHTFMPNDPGRNWENMNLLPHVPGATWLVQTYVPTLRLLGEWRVFIVGGEPVYIIHTKFHKEKSVWVWEFVEHFYSLEELSELSAKGTLSELKSPCNPVEGALQIRNGARAQFIDFVTKTYESLYRLESKMLGARSTISLFCRLDIGLIEHNNTVQYFVNEVERTQTTSLWTNPPRGTSMRRSRIDMLGSTFADTFYKWLEDLENPRIN